MIYLELLWGFLKVGLFAFGGAYGAIPLIRDIVFSYDWLTDEALTDMIAVSESTPGPIMVNLATYIGSSQAGLPGALLATTAAVLPSFLILLLVTALLKNVLKNVWVQAVLRGMKPCVTGIVLATGLSMVVRNCIPAQAPDIRAAILTVLLGGTMAVFRKFRKKSLSPILTILLAAAAGMLLYSL